jgi:hypothetical protein
MDMGALSSGETGTIAAIAGSIAQHSGLGAVNAGAVPKQVSRYQTEFEETSPHRFRQNPRHLCLPHATPEYRDCRVPGFTTSAGLTLSNRRCPSSVRLNLRMLRWNSRTSSSFSNCITAWFACLRRGALIGRGLAQTSQRGGPDDYRDRANFAHPRAIGFANKS